MTSMPGRRDGARPVPRPNGVAEETASPEHAFGNVIGESLAIRTAIALAQRVAVHPTTTVLLQGETGTGKELFARGIHYASPRVGEPFVAVNCAAIPETLLESELFGHERGAFTDAHAPKSGLFELAGRGTVFLDEIAEMPAKLQVKLLRVLETRRVRRVGGLVERTLDCRLVAATHADLSTAIAERRFREDLYYRINVFRIELPPLRLRESDIDMLARHFVASYCRVLDLPRKTLSDAVIALLRLHPWPGNIRELRNAVERATIVADGDTIEAEHLTLSQRERVAADIAVGTRPVVGAIPIPPGGLTLEAAERLLIDITLRMAHGNRSAAARMLGTSRPTLLRKLRRYGVAD